MQPLNQRFFKIVKQKKRLKSRKLPLSTKTERWTVTQKLFRLEGRWVKLLRV